MVLGKACNCKICSNYPAEVIGLREALGAGRLRLCRQLGGGARRERGAGPLGPRASQAAARVRSCPAWEPPAPEAAEREGRLRGAALHPGRCCK